MNGWPLTRTVPVAVPSGGPPGAPTTTKLAGQAGYERLVMPLRFDAVYELCPSRISIVTLPPRARLIRPAWTAAVQTELSSV